MSRASTRTSTRPLSVALVSEHANPLAALGGADAGGQNVHVAALAKALAQRGHQVTVYSRRESPKTPTRVPLTAGVDVVHVAAGPPTPLPKDELLPLISAFSQELGRQFAADRPDVVHAHFWMSGLASLTAARPVGVPVVQTFHALGVVKRRHQHEHDTSPARRLTIEAELAASVDRVIATCSDEVFELVRMNADRRRLAVIPCGVDTERFTPDGPVAARGSRPRVLSIGRLVPRKGVDDLITAVASVPGAELVVAGGPPGEAFGDDDEVRRLAALAQRLGVADRVRFLGAVHRGAVPALIRSADVVACPP